MTKSQAFKKYQKAATAYEDHIYSSRGTMRAVLSHEKAYFEARRTELQIKMRSAYKAYKAL